MRAAPGEQYDALRRASPWQHSDGASTILNRRSHRNGIAMSTRAPATLAPPLIGAKRGLWGRQLDRYPANGPRAFYLGLVVVITITMYYELYVQGAVATQITANLHMSLAYLMSVAIIGYGLGALASLFAGVADRWGELKAEARAHEAGIGAVPEAALVGAVPAQKAEAQVKVLSGH